jgi:hypothetical protein
MHIFRIILALLIAFAAMVPAHAESLCILREIVIFNCELKKSTASLCKSDENGALTYRSGSNSKVNMQLSDTGKGKGSVFFFSDAPYAGGGEAHIRFSRAAYTYYLYDKTVKTTEGPEFSAGIAIYKGQRKISNFACENDASIRAEAYKSITRESFQLIDSR